MSRSDSLYIIMQELTNNGYLFMKLHFFRLQFIFICLIMTACNNNDEPEMIHPKAVRYHVRYLIG